MQPEDANTPKDSGDLFLERQGKGYFVLRIIILVATLVVVACFLQFHLRPFYDQGMDGVPPEWFNTIGVRDFSALWLAVREVIRGGNPYQLMILCQVNDVSPIPITTSCVHLMPPWSLILMAPFMVFDWGLARCVSFVASVLSLIFAVEIVRRAVYPKCHRGWFLVIAAALLFVPALNCLYFGHIDLFLILSLALFYKSWISKKDWQAGLWLVPLTVKPQIFLILFVCLGLLVLYRRRYALFLWSIIWMVALIALTAFVFPGIFLNWLEAFPVITAFGRTVRGSGVSGFVRKLLWDGVGLPPSWPMVVFPFVGLALVCVWFYIKRKSFSGANLMGPALCISIFFSGYCWGNDLSLLIIPLCLILAGACCSAGLQVWERRQAIFDVFCLEVVLLVISLIGISPLEQMWWFPLVVIFLWYRNGVVTRALPPL